MERQLIMHYLTNIGLILKKQLKSQKNENINKNIIFITNNIRFN